MFVLPSATKYDNTKNVLKFTMHSKEQGVHNCGNYVNKLVIV